LIASRSRGHSTAIFSWIARHWSVSPATQAAVVARRALTVVGVGAVLRQCLRAGEQPFGAGLTVGRVHGEHEACRHQRQQGRAFFFFRGRDELGQPVAEAQPFVAQEIERADGRCVGIAHVQTLTVPCHTHPLVAPASHGVHPRAKIREEK